MTGRLPVSSSALTPGAFSLRSSLIGDPIGTAARGWFLTFLPLSLLALLRLLAFSGFPSASVCRRTRPCDGNVVLGSKSASIPPKVGAAERRGRPDSVTGTGRPSSPATSGRSMLAIAPRPRAVPPPRFRAPPRLRTLPLYSLAHFVA